MSNYGVNENVFGNILNEGETENAKNDVDTYVKQASAAPKTSFQSTKQEGKVKFKSVSFQIQTPNKAVDPINRPPLQTVPSHVVSSIVRSTVKKPVASGLSDTKQASKTPLSQVKVSSVRTRVQTPGGLGKRIFPSSPPQPVASSSSSTSSCSDLPQVLNTSTVTAATRDAVIQAKLQSAAEKQRQAMEQKQRWAQERDERLRLQQAATAEHQRKLRAQLEQHEEARRRNQEAQEVLLREQQERERAQLAASLEDRAHVARELEKRAKQRRRQSVMLNMEILQNAREKEAQLKMQAKIEEKDLLEARRLDRMAEEQAQQVEKMRRRASMACRGEEFRRQRDIEQQLRREKQLEEAALLQFRREAWADQERARDAELQKDRELLAEKLESWRTEKDAIKKKELQDEVQRQRDLTARRCDWLDVQFYKAELARSRRESVAGRLAQWRADKSVEAQLQREKAEAEDFDRLLRTQAQHDVDHFQATLQAQRRQSLAARLDKGRQDRQLTADQQLMQRLAEQQDHLLWLEDRAAVQEAEEKARVAARQSLLQRHCSEMQAKIAEKREQDRRAEATAAELARAEGEWRELQQFQKVQRELRRRSIVANYMESKRQHEFDLALHREALDKMHEELLVRREEWLDVQMHKQEQIRRRRESVGFRLDSWRQQRMAEEMLAMKKRLLAEEEAELRRLDFEAVERAREQARLVERQEYSNTRLQL